MGILLNEKLKEAQSHRKIVSLHTSASTFLGYILSINPDVMVVRTITRQGLLTGVRSIKMEDLSRVDLDDRYVRLIEFKEHNPEIAFSQPAAPEGLDDEYLTVAVLLRKAQEAHHMVLLELNSDSFYGYVEHLTDDELLLKVYTQYGEADGHTVLSIDSICSVVWSDENTRTVDLLLRQNGPDGRAKLS